MLAEAAEHSGLFVALHTPQLTIAKSSLAAARGLESRTVEIAQTAAEFAREYGQHAVEADALHHAARFGDRTAAPRLEQLARIVDGKIVAFQARHAAAVASSDARALDAISREFEDAGSLLSAAGAAALHDRERDRPTREESGARALRLAAECGGVVTPVIRRMARPPVS